MWVCQQPDPGTKGLSWSHLHVLAYIPDVSWSFAQNSAKRQLNNSTDFIECGQGSKTLEKDPIPA